MKYQNNKYLINMYCTTRTCMYAYLLYYYYYYYYNNNQEELQQYCSWFNRIQIILDLIRDLFVSYWDVC